MKLFVGLGNPGAKYEKTRHNIGFVAVEAIADAHGFAPFRSKFQGQLAEGRLGPARVMLLKPETFMNLSGQSVGEAMRYFKLEPQDVIVFHDELDLAPGRVKVKTGGGHAGHNGLRSLHEHIGAEYKRVRLGIGHPGDKRLVSPYVLHEFAKADWDWIDPLMAGICDGAALLALGDAGGFMNKVALRQQPPKAGRGAKPATQNSAKKSSENSSKDGPKDSATPAPEPTSTEAGSNQSDPALSAMQRLLKKYGRG